jgi:hypothetical protein
VADGILLRERVGYTEMNRGETGQEKSIPMMKRPVDFILEVKEVVKRQSSPSSFLRN